MAGAGKGVTHAGAGRPPALFPLFAGLETLPGVGPKAAEQGITVIDEDEWLALARG